MKSKTGGMVENQSGRDRSTATSKRPAPNEIVAYTMNPCSSHNLQVEVGGQVKTIHITSVPSAFDLDYSLPRPAQRVALSGIVPRSARSVGLAPDDRAVGVGLVKIECGDSRNFSGRVFVRPRSGLKPVIFLVTVRLRLARHNVLWHHRH
jgi:hypothetical protein